MDLNGLKWLHTMDLHNCWIYDLIPIQKQPLISNSGLSRVYWPLTRLGLGRYSVDFFSNSKLFQRRYRVVLFVHVFSLSCHIDWRKVLGKKNNIFPPNGGQTMVINYGKIHQNIPTKKNKSNVKVVTFTSQYHMGVSKKRRTPNGGW